MAEIQEVFEDFAENTKKAVKSKPFMIAAVGVGLVALFVGWQRNRKSSDDSGPYEAVGYAGYPTVGGSGGSYSDDATYYESLISEYQTSISDMQSEHNSVIADLTQQYDSTLDELQTNILDLSEKQKSTEEALAERDYSLQMERDISQMKANSEMYNILSKPEQASIRESLHAENLAIAEKYGWEFDSKTGNYYDGNNVVYSVAWQQAAKRAGSSGVTTSGGVSTAKKASTGTAAYENNASYSKRVAKTVTANSDGNAPSGTNVGDTVVTKGGTYKVVAPNTEGASYNKASGLWSVKVSDKTS